MLVSRRVVLAALAFAFVCVSLGSVSVAAAGSTFAAPNPVIACQDACSATNDACSKKCGTDESCLDRCVTTYQFMCVPQCQPTVALCANACQNAYSQCESWCRDFYCSCPADYDSCTQACGSTPTPTTVKAAEVESSVEAESIVEVMGVRECVKGCKTKGKDAANKCKHEKFAQRASCYARVPNTVKACESGCNRKPHGLESRPLLGDCQPCDAIYDQCLPACNGMSNCQLQCMRTHFDCRMATPGC